MGTYLIVKGTHRHLSTLWEIIIDVYVIIFRLISDYYRRRNKICAPKNKI